MPNHKTNTHTAAGGHQEIHIGVWKRDRLGMLAGSNERHRRENFDARATASGYLNVSAAPPEAVPCVNVQREYKSPYAIYQYSYEGVEVDYEFGDHETIYELDIAMSEDAIETHLNFAALKLKYGWNASKRAFAEFLPALKSNAILGAAGIDLPRSDLYGTDSYLAVGAHYRISFARHEVPSWATKLINEIVKTPRGIQRFKLPAWAKKRNWLCLGPHAIDRGNVSKIDVDFLLSGPRGWNKDVYGTGKLGGGDDGGDAAAI